MLVSLGSHTYYRWSAGAGSRQISRHLRFQRFIDRRLVDIDKAAISAVFDLPDRILIAVGGLIGVVSATMRTIPFHHVDRAEIRALQCRVNRLG
jgi:hypothetical protein